MNSRKRTARPIAWLFLSLGAMLATVRAVTIEGEVIDAATGRPLPARLYIQGADGQWHFAQSATTEGSAIRYDRQRANTNAIERHTTLSAHPFRAELPPGRYTFTAMRGKEYRSATQELAVGDGAPRVSLALRRWSDMAEAGWYSGDTHVHRAPAELANVMLAEDVNVTLPLLDWTIDTQVPATGDPRSVGGQFPTAVTVIDATHVWHPRNTEFEIFRVANRPHRLGAFFVLNHRSRFAKPLFPLAEVIAQARAEGALLDLEKHNWEWTIAMAPVLKPDVIELANNHHWQVEYAVKNWAVPAPAWMKLSGTGTDNERDWTLYGFQTYYALLNSGLRIAPTAGSASGVHPVPLGFSRVYVQLDGPFSYEAWLGGLAEGRSFVTTGPMLRARAAGRWPGATFPVSLPAHDLELQCSVVSEHPLESIELIVDGEVRERFAPGNEQREHAFTSDIKTRFRPAHTSWIAWRCFEQRPGGRIRFAHTAPWYFTVAGQPQRARRAEAEWLVRRVEEEMARSRGVVPAELLAAYEQSLKFYRDALNRALER